MRSRRVDYITRAKNLIGIVDQLMSFRRKAVKRADKAYWCFEAVRILNLLLHRWNIDPELRDSLDFELNHVIDGLDDISKITPAFELVSDLVLKIRGRLDVLLQHYREVQYSG
jgi:hypothetical protein